MQWRYRKNQAGKGPFQERARRAAIRNTNPAVYLLGAVMIGLGVVDCAPERDPAGSGRIPAESGAPRGATTDHNETSLLENSRPNIVLITICTCRYSHMGFSGYARRTTPFMDSLVAGGVLFENAMGTSSWTKPATASILTGLTPNVHQMTDYYDYQRIRGQGFTPKRVLADGIVTLAECLSEAGYATVCRNNNIHAGHFFNMTQGFDDAPAIGRSYGTSRMLHDFDRWLSKLDQNTPFFFFMLTADAHLPYLPQYKYYRQFARSSPKISQQQLHRFSAELRAKLTALDESKAAIPPVLKQQWIDLYDAELLQLDTSLSILPRILERAGRTANTVIVVTADHGELMFGAHGALGHSRPFMEEHLVHIPLILHGAGLPAGVRFKQLVRSIDLYPTLAALAGAAIPEVVQGRSLLPVIGGDPAFPELSGFASYAGATHVVRSGTHKLHRFSTGTMALFDIASDPDEERNLIDTHPELARRMQAQLEEWLAQEEALRPIVGRSRTRKLPPEVIEQLRALGYIE